MRIIRYPWGFWGQIFAVIPGEVIGIYFIVTEVFIKGDNTHLIWLIYLLYLFSYTPFNCKDYFTILTFSEEGVKASLFGWIWFKASWNEISHIGEFMIAYNAGGYARCMYFSKEKVTLKKRLMGQRMCPISRRVKEDAVFTMMSDKNRKKLLDYIDKEQIELRGAFTRKREFV